MRMKIITMARAGEKCYFVKFSLPEFFIQAVLLLSKFRKDLQALVLHVHGLEKSYPVPPACMDILKMSLVL